MTFSKSNITTPISIERTLRISKCLSYSLFFPLSFFFSNLARIHLAALLLQNGITHRRHILIPPAHESWLALYLIRGIPFWACTVCIFNRNTSSVGRFLDDDDDFFLSVHIHGLTKENSHNSDALLYGSSSILVHELHAWLTLKHLPLFL